jgi:hypothetical protein
MKNVRKWGRNGAKTYEGILEGKNAKDEGGGGDDPK